MILGQCRKYYRATIITLSSLKVFDASGNEVFSSSSPLPGPKMTDDNKRFYRRKKEMLIEICMEGSHYCQITFVFNLFTQM